MQRYTCSAAPGLSTRQEDRAPRVTRSVLLPNQTVLQNRSCLARERLRVTEGLTLLVRGAELWRSDLYLRSSNGDGRCETRNYGKPTPDGGRTLTWSFVKVKAIKHVAVENENLSSLEDSPVRIAHEWVARSGKKTSIRVPL